MKVTVVQCPEGCPCIGERWVRWPVDALVMFVITTGTTDFGAKFVLRMHEVRAGWVVVHRRPLAVHDTLEDARACVPGYADRKLPLYANDDPVIVESWC